MLHVDWRTESYGASNCHGGEYDTALYFTVCLGVPVYFSFRSCVHVIELAKVGPGERLERLRGFAKPYLGIADLTPHRFGILHLPLRPLGSLIDGGAAGSLAKPQAANGYLLGSPHFQLFRRTIHALVHRTADAHPVRRLARRRG